MRRNASWQLKMWLADTVFSMRGSSHICQIHSANFSSLTAGSIFAVAVWRAVLFLSDNRSTKGLTQMLSFFFCLHIHLISKNEEQHGFVHSTQWKKLWWNIFSSYQMTEVWHKITVNQSAHDLNMKKSLYVLLKTQLCQIVFLWDLHFPTVKLKPSNNL